MIISTGSRIAIPVVCYLLLTSLISVAAWPLQDAAGIDPVLISVVQFAPALGGLGTLLGFRRARRWASQLTLGAPEGTSSKHIVAAVAGPVGMLLLTLGLCTAAGIAVPVTGLGSADPPVAALLIAGGFHFIMNIGLLVLGNGESDEPGFELALGLAAVLTAAVGMGIARLASGSAGR